MKKTGFVGLIGRPNVGKSTLLNSILEMKLSIISSKPQTTRNIIRGVYNDDDSQVIFIDTPGIHKPKHELGNYMNKVAVATLNEMDIALFLIDVSEEFGGGNNYILNLLKDVSCPVILVINKIDKINNDKLIEKIDQYKNIYNFSEIVPISSLEGRNINTLLDVIKSKLLPNYEYYDSDTYTDISDIFYIKEIIREKILYHTQEEIPHSVAIEIDDLIEGKNSIEIFASIIVERDSQKGILIGKRGAMIKQLGSESRAELTKYKSKKVHLNLIIKVDKNWRSNSRSLNRYGYTNK
ncbi:MAG: GTPase Era [Bacilli bacterium]